MCNDTDTILVLTGITDKQADSIVKYIIRQQENNRFETCQAQKNVVSELVDGGGVPTLRIYGVHHE